MVYTFVRVPCSIPCRPAVCNLQGNGQVYLCLCAYNLLCVEVDCNWANIVTNTQWAARGGETFPVGFTLVGVTLSELVHCREWSWVGGV